jgi:uncharacterized protein YjbJ (UPF0337 family)
LLSALWGAAFDQCLVSFADDGSTRANPKLSEVGQSATSPDAGLRSLWERTNPRCVTSPQIGGGAKGGDAGDLRLRNISRGELAMDWNRVEGNWKQLKGKIKEKWGDLTDDDLDKIAGRRDQLEGKIQERYGFAKDQVQRDVDDWLNAQEL